jgi:hypothetical protein
MDIALRSFGSASGRTCGAVENGYVDARLPLPGKEEHDDGRRATCESGAARRDHPRTIDDPSPCAKPDGVVGLAPTDYSGRFVFEAVSAETSLAAASRTLAIFGFGPLS